MAIKPRARTLRPAGPEPLSAGLRGPLNSAHPRHRLGSELYPAECARSDAARFEDARFEEKLASTAADIRKSSSDSRAKPAVLTLARRGSDGWRSSPAGDPRQASPGPSNSIAMAMSAEIKSVSPLGARTSPSYSKRSSGLPARMYRGPFQAEREISRATDSCQDAGWCRSIQCLNVISSSETLENGMSSPQAQPAMRTFDGVLYDCMYYL